MYKAAATKHNGKCLLLLTLLGNTPFPEFYVAQSENGIDFTVNQTPAITALSEEDWICDPRITFMNGTYYILYWSGSKFGVRTVLTTTHDFKKFTRHGYICEPDNRNMALFPEKIHDLYVRLDRPYGTVNAGSVWISYSPDLIYWGNSKPVLDKGVMFQWEYVT